MRQLKGHCHIEKGNLAIRFWRGKTYYVFTKKFFFREIKNSVLRPWMRQIEKRKIDFLHFFIFCKKWFKIFQWFGPKWADFRPISGPKQMIFLLQNVPWFCPNSAGNQSKFSLLRPDLRSDTSLPLGLQKNVPTHL